MTRAPANLLAVRSLLLAELDLKPTSVSADLDPAEVGIVGDPNHRGGYHCGSDRVVANDYSVVESSKDRSGLTLDAAALDVGWFEWRSPLGVVHNLRTFSTWCVNQCRANTPDSRDIREIIYTTDGKSVRRWDRLGKRSTGDSSHLSHTHFSYFRDAVKAGRDQRPLFRRYLTEIGLLAGEDEDMDQKDPLLHSIPGDPDADVGWALADVSQFVALMIRKPTDPKVQGVAVESGSVVDVMRKMSVQMTALSGKDFTDEPAIVAGVLAGLDPAAIAAAIPADLAQRVADELAARLAQ